MSYTTARMATAGPVLVKGVALHTYREAECGIKTFYLVSQRKGSESHLTRPDVYI